MTRDPGVLGAAAVGVGLLAFAVSVDVPKTALGFKGDEATYYSLAHSLARDFDFAFEHKDLTRVWEEYSTGPEGIFLKRGKTIRLTTSSRFPFMRWRKGEDPVRTRLYYSKSFIYPLVAAPFVFAFGTNGFLVLHALLLSLNLFVAYAFLAARGSRRGAAFAYAAAFLAASVVPVYFVWLTPELFNVSLALWAMFLWSYKEAKRDVPKDDAPADHGPAVGAPAFLLGAGSDDAAAALVGVLAFSKPTHAILMLPLVGLALLRGEWRRAIRMTAAWVLVAGALFAANAAITGEFNYQGGDRKTFYGRSGFPFANQRETFESMGPVRGRESVMVGNVLANAHSVAVFRRNIVYFLVGRFCGLVPYFFPGVVSAFLFLTYRRRPWQWLTAATLALAALVLLVITPFTYSGGGGPVGNRYFLAYYPLFLFLTPPLTGVAGAAVALTAGSLFTAKILLNPFYSSFHPGEHAKYGPLRWLPIELTLLNDLPMAADPDRTKRPLGGTPPVLAYFADDNAFNPEGAAFWVRGKSRADVILRAPVVEIGPGRFVSKTIERLIVQVQNGGDPGTVTVSTGQESRTLAMNPADVARFTLRVEPGLPYTRDENPTSYLYSVSIRASGGFVPFLNTSESSDSRFLGALIQLTPAYADAETSTWSTGERRE